VAFVLEDESGARNVKTVALPYPDLLRATAAAGRDVDDSWCSRLAAMHVLGLVETGEDMEKDYITVPPADLERHAAALRREEQEAVAGR